jgi:hypothetical protein
MSEGVVERSPETKGQGLDVNYLYAHRYSRNLVVEGQKGINDRRGS